MSEHIEEAREHLRAAFAAVNREPHEPHGHMLGKAQGSMADAYRLLGELTDGYETAGQGEVSPKV